jgi:hypothetical protein
MDAPVASASKKIQCVIEGVLPLNATLLDSGSDVSLVSMGLVKALMAAGSRVTMIEAPSPLEVRPYGVAAPAIVVTQQIRLASVQFDTTSGPLVLRGLLLWVDETVGAGVELLVGLPVMERLGYSAESVLANARVRAEVWDMDESRGPTAMSRVNRLMLAEIQIDDVMDDPEVPADCAQEGAGGLPYDDR